MASSDEALTNPDEQLEPVPEASVVIDDLSPTDFAAKFTSEPMDLNIWQDYMVMNRYEKDRHVAMLPIASPTGFGGKSVAFCQLAAPTLLWVADWTASRWQTQPKIPDPDVADSNWVLMDEHVEPAMVVTGPDGVTPLYRISGTYVYGHKNPSKVMVDDCNFGRTPWLDDDFPRFVDSSMLTPNLIDGEGGGSSGGGSPTTGAASSTDSSPGVP